MCHQFRSAGIIPGRLLQPPDLSCKNRPLLSSLERLAASQLLVLSSMCGVSAEPSAASCFQSTLSEHLSRGLCRDLFSQHGAFKPPPPLSPPTEQPTRGLIRSQSDRHRLDLAHTHHSGTPNVSHFTSLNKEAAVPRVWSYRDKEDDLRGGACEKVHLTCWIFMIPRSWSTLTFYSISSFLW